MSLRRSKRIRWRRKLWSHERVRSTTQRNLPRPLPCSVRRRAITGLLPRSRKLWRCVSESLTLGLRAGQCHTDRYSVGVYEDMVLRTWSRAIRLVWPGFSPAQQLSRTKNRRPHMKGPVARIRAACRAAAHAAYSRRPLSAKRPGAASRSRPSQTPVGSASGSIASQCVTRTRRR